MYVTAVESGRKPGAAVLDQMNLNERMPDAVFRQKPGQYILDDLRCGADAKKACLRSLQSARAFLNRRNVGEDTPAPRKEVLSFGCQSYASPDSIEQRHSELGFQREHLT